MADTIFGLPIVENPCLPEGVVMLSAGENVVYIINLSVDEDSPDD